MATPSGGTAQPPPPSEPKSGGGIFRALAQYCWLSIPLSIVAYIALGAMRSVPLKESSQVDTIVVGMIWLSGILSGIIAFFGIRHYGRRGILIPAVVGLSLWMLMIPLVNLAIPTFKRIQERAARINASASSSEKPASSLPPPAPGSVAKPASIAQSPPVYPDGSTRVEDNAFGFTFAVPEGYAAATEKKPDEVHSFKRKFFTEPARIIAIRKVDGDYSRRSATAEDLPPPGPGQISESAVFDWRGRKVGGTRSVDAKKNPPYLVFNIVVPLRKQTMVLEVGGAAEYEPVIMETLDQILGSLVEESNP